MELLSSYEDSKRGKYHINSITDVGRKIGSEYQNLLDMMKNLANDGFVMLRKQLIGYVRY